MKNSGNVYDCVYSVQKQLTITTNGSGAGSVTIGDGTFETPAAGTFVALSSTSSVSPTLFTLSGSNNVLNIAGGPLSSIIYIYATVTKTALAPRTKTLTTVNSEAYVVGSSVTSITLTKSDIYRITLIQMGGADVTNQYVLDNGQTDYGYYKGKLSLKTAGVIPEGTLDVTYEYFAHTAGDYFSIDSYSGNANYLDLIVNYRNASGTVFNLLNCIDARPTVGSAGTFDGGTGAIVGDMLVSAELYTSSVQYFVPRYDVLTINKDAVVSVVTETSEGTVALETYFVPAYTKQVSAIKKTRNLVDRYTMNGIAKLEQRVARLEVFSTLSQAESSTIHFEVVDPATGISRFKTGYLVENFTSPFTIGDIGNPDFGVSFDYSTLNSGLERMECSTTVLPSSGHYVNVDGMYMLPYTEVTFASQPLSSRVTNLNPFLMITWDGSMNVTPSADNWIDILDLPTVFNEIQEPDVNLINWVPSPVSAPAIPQTNLPVTAPSTGGSATTQPLTVVRWLGADSGWLYSDGTTSGGFGGGSSA